MFSFFWGFGEPRRAYSDCGEQFDRYTNLIRSEAVSDDQYTSNMMEGRRALLYCGNTNDQNDQNDSELPVETSPHTPREAKVMRWHDCDDEDSSPWNPKSVWLLDMVFLDFQKGDSVFVRDIPKAHDGKEGVIAKCLSNEKYKIWLPHALRMVIVEKEHLEQTERCFVVHRMNIHGGGTLICCRIGLNQGDFIANGDDMQPHRLASLEWIDPVPDINLFNDHVTNVTCPTCRAVEPPEVAFQEANETTLACCPICTETKGCRSLQCQHQICVDCWKQWKISSTTKIPIGEPVLDPDMVQRQRDMNFQKLQATLPHTFGGKATKGTGRRKSSEEDIKRAEEHFGYSAAVFLNQLYDGNGWSEANLASFWEKLLTMPVHLLCGESLRGLPSIYAFVSVVESIAAVEIVMRVVQQRGPEISKTLKVLRSSRLCSLQMASDSDQDVWDARDEKCCEDLYRVCCNRIGELYENSNRIATAIHWFERALAHAIKRYGSDSASNSNCVDSGCVDSEWVKDCKERVSFQYWALGSARENMGFLTNAMEQYEASLKWFPLEASKESKRSLESELEEWTGCSGKLTPRC